MSDDEKSTKNTTPAWFRPFEKLLQEIHTCLVGGNRLRGGKPGMVDFVEENTKDIAAIQPRLEQCEKAIQTIQEERKLVARLRKIFYAAATGTILVAAFWDSLSAMFTKIFK